MENKNIVMIEIDKLEAHPKNPRKKLGDLTELTGSISKNGVYQNLTVVPFGDNYRVVIGHRRLAASKKAGMKELPCVISDMNEEEQLATMLAENMQRSDLTLYEQAKGMNQLVLDFGTPAQKISDMTGISKTTVKRRLKLCELTAEQFDIAESRNVSLFDYEKLLKIEDPAERDKVFVYIGTKNFEYYLNQALQRQKNKKQVAKLTELLDRFAKRVQSSNVIPNQRYVKCYNVDSEISEEDIPADAKTRQYYYTISDWGGYAYLYVDSSEDKEKVYTPEELEAQKKAADRRDRVIKLETIAKNAYECRVKFIKNADLKGYEKEVMKFATFACCVGYEDYDIDTYCDLNGVSFTKDEKQTLDETEYDYDVLWPSDHLVIDRAINKDPLKALLTASYLCLNDNAIHCWSWNSPVYSINTHLVDIYTLLGTLGYEMSDEEERYVFGTHELYVKEGEE